MDRSSASAPLLALKLEIGAPPDFREIETKNSGMGKGPLIAIFEPVAEAICAVVPDLGELTTEMGIAPATDG